MEVFIDDCAKPSVFALFCDEKELELLMQVIEFAEYVSDGNAELHPKVQELRKMSEELNRVAEFPSLLKKQAD